MTPNEINQLILTQTVIDNLEEWMREVRHYRTERDVLNEALDILYGYKESL